MSLTIAVDMDGTVADWTSSACKRAKEIYGIDITRNDIEIPVFADLVNAKYIEQKGEELEDKGKQVYDKICSGNFYRDLDPLPGAIKAIEEIFHEGHQLVFLTKPTDWTNSSQQKIEWLENWFGHLKYDVIMVSEISRKHLINVPIIIDDDPRALKNHPVAIPVCIAHPWNKKFRDSDEVGMVVINHLSELPKQIQFIQDLLKEENELLI